MQSEVQKIPPAPRRLRIRPLLAHRWPLLAIGGAMVVLGGLVAWAMFLQSGGKLGDDPLLASGPVETVDGEVTAVLDATHFDDRDWHDVRYQFDYVARIEGREPGRTIEHSLPLQGMCYVPLGTCRVGQAVRIRVLEGDRNVHCIVGGVKHIHRQWLYARFWLLALVVPGALILLAWLTGVFQLRQVLVHGDVSVGRVLAVTPVRWVLPEMLRVQYEFRDHRARVRKNRHWVRAHGALGRRLTAPSRARHKDGLPVLHDRRLPHWNRLLLAEDCLRSNDRDLELPQV